MSAYLTDSISRIGEISNKIDVFLKQCQLPVRFFNHDMTFKNGFVAMLSSQAEFPVHYHATRTPLILRNHEGRMLADGAYLSHYLIDTVKEYKQLMSPMKKQFSWQHSLSIAINKADQQHLYTFFFDTSESEFLQHVLNYYYLYQQMITKYNQQFVDVIDNEREKHQSDFPLSELLIPTQVGLSVLNEKKANIIIPSNELDPKIAQLLSPQQSKCLTLLIKGMSSKEIAREMNLSYRTIEHYLSDIKKKLHSKNIKELIARCS